MLEDMVDPPRALRRLEVITGAGGRRRWSDAEKARIVEEAIAPGCVVSQVARRHGMAPQHLFTWIRQARRPLSRTEEPAPLFVPALGLPRASRLRQARRQDHPPVGGSTRATNPSRSAFRGAEAFLCRFGISFSQGQHTLLGGSK